MIWVTHLIGSIFFLLLLKKIGIMYFGSQTYLIITLVFTLIGSLLPDIDEEKSLIGKKLKIGKFIKHRGILHGIIPLIIFTIFILLTNGLAKKIFSGLMIGYSSHILLDGLTPMGVDLSFIKIRGVIKTGSIIEYILLGFLCIAIIYLLMV